MLKAKEPLSSMARVRSAEAEAAKAKANAEWAKVVKVSPRLVVIFSKQLASMLGSGVPIAHALDTLSYQPENPTFGSVIGQLNGMIEKGLPFSRSLATFPRVFAPMFVTMVQIGEQTGTLDKSLARLSSWVERDEALRQRLKSAFSYPIFVFVLTTILTLGLFYTIMPGFIGIFHDMKIQLPAITRLVVWITDTIRNPGALLMGVALVGVLIKLFLKWTSTPDGRCSFHKICLRIPLIGGILKCGGIARYCGALEALLTNGLGMVQALKMAASASGDPLIKRDSISLCSKVTEGEFLSQILREQPAIYPTMLVNFIASGEETSSVPELCGRCGAFYDSEMNLKVEALGAALEPLMLFGVSSMVGTIVLSIFIPLYSYIGNLGQ